MDDTVISRVYTYFFKNKEALAIFDQIKQRKYNMSLRLIEYTLTNYVLIHPIEYFVVKYKDIRKLNEFLLFDDPDFSTKWQQFKDNNDEILEIYRFNMRVDYELMFRKYHKRFFDPCCRSKNDLKVNVLGIETVFKQLHFFYWAFDNALIAWIKQHKTTISKEMSADEMKKKKREPTTSTTEKPRLHTLKRKRDRIVKEKEEVIITKMPFVDITESHTNGDIFNK